MTYCCVIDHGGSSALCTECIRIAERQRRLCQIYISPDRKTKASASICYLRWKQRNAFYSLSFYEQHDLLDERFRLLSCSEGRVGGMKKNPLQKYISKIPCKRRARINIRNINFHFASHECHILLFVNTYSRSLSPPLTRMRVYPMCVCRERVRQPKSNGCHRHRQCSRQSKRKAKPADTTLFIVKHFIFLIFFAVHSSFFGGTNKFTPSPSSDISLSTASHRFHHLCTEWALNTRRA